LALRLEIFFALGANAEEIEPHGQSPRLLSPERFMQAGVTFCTGGQMFWSSGNDNLFGI
jgi:hypothetical protein